MGSERRQQSTQWEQRGAGSYCCWGTSAGTRESFLGEVACDVSGERGLGGGQQPGKGGSRFPFLLCAPVMLPTQQATGKLWCQVPQFRRANPSTPP